MTKQAENSEENDLDRLIWGGRAIAAAIGKTPMATFHLLEKRLIPARKVGGQWVTSRRRLLEISAPTP